MGFKTNIEDYAIKNPTYSAKLTKINALIEAMRNKLQIIPFYFRHFSRHDESHSEAIIHYLEMLLGKNAIERISMSDQLMIVLASYAHDIGMSLEYKDIKSMFNNENFDELLRESIPKGYKDLDTIVERLLEDPLAIDNECDKNVLKLYSDVSIAIENLFRKGHSERSEDYIITDEQMKSLLGIRCTFLLGKICSKHEQSIDNIMDLPYEENGVFGDYLHPRFIAGMLCLGDLLDLDTDRFDEKVLRASCDMPLLSQIHKKKHECIRHYLVKDSCIEIEADCDEYVVYGELKQWTGWIEEACKFLVINWDEVTPYRHIMPPRLKLCRIKINGNDRWESFADSKIHVEAEKAVKLFQGTNIYDGKYIFLRELIQNAVDASLIQLYKDVRELEYFSHSKVINAVDILAAVNKDEIDINNYNIVGKIYEFGETGKEKDVYFELRDYGTGIAETDIKAIVGMKGKRTELKTLIEEIPEFFRPSGAFGIGIQSVFQIASEIIYITKTDEELPKKITIKDPALGGAVYVEDYRERFKRGTKVIVKLDSLKFNREDFKVGNFIFNNTSLNTLIMQWIKLSLKNIYSNSILNEKESSFIEDYFNITISEQGDNNKKGNVVLRRESFIPKMAEKYSDKLFRIENNKLLYKYYDLDKNCIFEVTANLGKKDDLVFNGQQNDSFYGEEILYRNVSATQGIRNLSFLTNWENTWFNYRINLFSDSASDVLTLGRNNITDTYSGKISNIVKYEMALFYKEIIDKCIVENDFHNYLIVAAFIGASVYGYRDDEMYQSNKAVLDKAKLGGFYDLNRNNAELEIVTALKEKMLFLFEIDKENEVYVPSCVWKNLDGHRQIDDSDIVFLWNGAVGLLHTLIFELESTFFTKYKQKKYICFEVSHYHRNNKEKVAYKQAGFLRYKTFLEAIFGDASSVLSIENYASIETPISSCSNEADRDDDPKIIEVRIDDSIRQKIIETLEKDGYLKNSKAILEDIYDSDIYEQVIDYIAKYQGSTNGIKKTEIEKIYSKFIQEELLLISEKKYSKYLKDNFDDFKNINENDYIAGINVIDYAGMLERYNSFVRYMDVPELNEL